jgi:hypothetical protein
VRFEFLKDAEVLKLTRSGLAAAGPVVAKVTARAVAPAQGAYAGIVVTLDGAAPQDRTPPGDPSGTPVFNFYSLEVVQRIGYDSFTPDNGVLLAKNKNNEGNTCGYNCFTWVIDAHPEDIRMVDFKRPNGEPVMRTVADYRQLNDALFHAGLNSGSQFEWEDTPNGLHFYVVDLSKDERGILTYTLGVRSLESSGPIRRGVALSAGANCEISLTNTAESGVDLYRLSVSAGGELRNMLAAVPAGESQRIEILGTGSITLRATSESDPAKSARTTCRR